MSGPPAFLFCSDITLDDASRETLAGDNGDDIIEVGERLRGVLTIENFQYASGAGSESTGGGNDNVVAVFEAEVINKLFLGGGLFNFQFAAPGGGQGVVATFYSLPGGIIFDIAQDGDAALSGLFTGGTKLFDLSIIPANGDFWFSLGPEDINDLTLTNSASIRFDLTMTDEQIAGVEFLSDAVPLIASSVLFRVPRWKSIRRFSLS